jgi:hypothetical protein
MFLTDYQQNITALHTPLPYQHETPYWLLVTLTTTWTDCHNRLSYQAHFALSRATAGYPI